MTNHKSGQSSGRKNSFIECEECSTKFSPKADRCPSCGASGSTERWERIKAIGLKVCIISFFIILPVGGMVGKLLEQSLLSNPESYRWTPSIIIFIISAFLMTIGLLMYIYAALRRP